MSRPKTANENDLQTVTTVRTKRRNKRFFATFAAVNGCSQGQMVNWFIENILSGSYGDEILDRVVEWSKLPKYRI